MQNKLKKTLIMLLIAVVVVSTSFFAPSPKKADAQFVDVQQFLKEFGLDTIPAIIGSILVNKMSQSIYGWASGGYEGNPLAALNFKDIFKTAALNVSLEFKDDLVKEMRKQDGKDQQRLDSLNAAKDSKALIQEQIAALENKIQELEETDPLGTQIQELRMQLVGVKLSLTTTDMNIARLDDELQGSPLSTSLNTQENTQEKRQEKLDEIERLEEEISERKAGLIGLDEDLRLAEESGENTSGIKSEIRSINNSIKTRQAQIQILEGQMNARTAVANVLPSSRVGYARESIRFLGVVTAAKQNKREYDLDKVIEKQCGGSVEGYYNDFSTCGWAAWDAQFSNQKNNTLGAQLSALDELNKKVATAQEEEERELSTGGFLPQKKCLEEKTLSNGTKICIRDVIEKPADFVKDQVLSAANLPKEQITQVTEFDQLAKFALQKLITTTIDIGFMEAGKLYNKNIAPALGRNVFSGDDEGQNTGGALTEETNEEEGLVVDASGTFKVISEETSLSGFNPGYIASANTVVDLEELLLGTKLIKRDENGIPLLSDDGNLVFEKEESSGQLKRSESRLDILIKASEKAIDQEEMFKQLEDKAYEAEVCALGPDYKYKSRMKTDFDSSVGGISDRDEVRDLKAIFDKGRRFIDDSLLFVTDAQEDYHSIISVRELAVSILKEDKLIAVKKASDYRRASSVYKSVKNQYDRLKTKNINLELLGESEKTNYYRDLDRLARQLHSASETIIFDSVLVDLEFSAQDIQSSLDQIDETLKKCWADRVLLDKEVNTYDAAGLLHCPFEQSILADNGSDQYVTTGVFDENQGDIFSTLSLGSVEASGYKKFGSSGRFVEMLSYNTFVRSGQNYASLSFEERIVMGQELKEKTLAYREKAKIKYIFKPIEKGVDQSTKFDILPCRAFYYSSSDDYVLQTDIGGF